MNGIKAENGQLVTDEMIDGWCEALDDDKWPRGWRNVGDAVSGQPPVKTEKTAVISLKVPVGMKRAIEKNAAREGLSVSAYARRTLEEKLLA